MIELLKIYQLDIMLALSSVCAILALLAAITKAMPRDRKMALIYIELSACFLLFFDRMSYIHSGNDLPSEFALTKLANFMVFILTIAFLHATGRYIADLSVNEMGLPKVPMRLRAVEFLAVIGWALIVINEFTGFYFYYDENYKYQRGDLFLLSYIIPFIILALQLSLITRDLKRLSRPLRISMIIFFICPIAAAVLQYYNYGISFINITIVGTAVILYILALKDMNDKIESAKKSELETVKEERSQFEHAFIQAATVIASTVDSREIYASGHSQRVAKYSKMIAERAGLSPRACQEVYFSGLLHDIGKIGITDAVLLRDHAPTDEDKKKFKEHTEIGAKILSSVSDFPYLPIAAKYHHERYDGNGYPEGLKGDKIPLYARIVTVADVYDSMTSPKRTRGPMPQGRVREVFVSGAHKQFDPKFASIMVDIIDQDTEYKLQAIDDSDEEISESYDLTKIKSVTYGAYKKTVTDGLKIDDTVTKIHLRSTPNEGADPKISIPTIIVFDSFDSCVHTDERKIRNQHYLEFAEIWFDGHSISTKARNMKTEVTKRPGVKPADPSDPSPREFDIEAYRYKDHLRIIIDTVENRIDTIIALPDSARASLIGIAGENCKIDMIDVQTSEEKIPEGKIPRIAEEINIINLLDGDIPNIQCDGRRTAITEGIRIDDSMRVEFHTRTLPSANLVSCCPYIVIYHSDDGRPNGRNYKEYACIRLDGENVTEGDSKMAVLEVKRDKDFIGWDAWKSYNKKGYECELDFRRRRNVVTMNTKNAGINIKCMIPALKTTHDIYLALSGEACAVMDIRAYYD